MHIHEWEWYFGRMYFVDLASVDDLWKAPGLSESPLVVSLRKYSDIGKELPGKKQEKTYHDNLVAQADFAALSEQSSTPG